MTDTVHSVVAGTDGSAPAAAAVARAAWEADRRGVPLRVVHGYPMPYLGLGLVPYDADTVYPTARARTMLADTAARIHETHPDLKVETTLIAGAPGGTLVAESARASLVVVGSRGLGGFTGLLLGSVSAQLAAHSRAPVIVMRDMPGQNITGAPSARPVVVGVDGLPESAPVLEFAFDQAAALGVPLIAVYVWWILPWTNLGPVDRQHYDLVEAGEEARRMLSETLAGWCEKYPDVIVELRPTHEMNPVLAMLDASERAGLVVVGRHGGNAVTRLMLASIGDALIRQAACPVAVVPHATS